MVCSWRSLFTLAAIFIVSPFLQVSATVQRFLPGWVGLKKKRQNDVSRGNFGTDATPKKMILEFSIEHNVFLFKTNVQANI